MYFFSSLFPIDKGATAAAGAVDEDSFLRSFEDVPKVQIFSGKNTCEQMMKIKETLENGSIEWDKRVDAVIFFFFFLTRITLCGPFAILRL